ncbi:hypothetical protein Hanom_Chr09g00853071 [Helianthus anomalus]
MASTQISFTVHTLRRIFKLSDLLLNPLKCLLKTTFSFRHPLQSFGRILVGNCAPYRHNTMLRRTDSFAGEQFIEGVNIEETMLRVPVKKKDPSSPTFLVDGKILRVFGIPSLFSF